MGKFIFFVIVVVGAILLVTNWDDDGGTDDESSTEVVEIEESSATPEPEPKPQLPTKKVRIYRANGDPIVSLCKKVSNVATRLPAPYGEGLRGIRKARDLGWCISAKQGDILRVSDEYWNVHEYPIEENWPVWFPDLIKVYTEDGKDWWIREDSLNIDSVPVK